MPVGILRQQKYRLLSYLPGKRGLRYLRKYGRSRRASVDAAFEAALEAARGRVCIDLGANLGEYTLRMAKVASRVIAFEPDPWTAARLRQAVESLHNVEVVEAAAATEDGYVPIYRTSAFEADPEKNSLSTSLLAEKSNIDPSSSETVRVLDFCTYLERLNTDVALLKIDIEGAEVALLERLLDHPVLNRIDRMFVETHESKLPALAPRSRKLRRRVARLKRPDIDMDWR